MPYSSRVLTIENLPKQINSSLNTAYLNDDENTKGNVCLNFYY